MFTLEDEVLIKIEAINIANKMAIKVKSTMVDYFRQYVGQVIMRRPPRRGFTVRVGKNMPIFSTHKIEFPSGPVRTARLDFFDNCTDYSIYWTVVSTCISRSSDINFATGDIHSHRSVVYIGELSDGVVLKSVNENEPRFVQYDPDETVEEIRRLKKLKAEVQEIEDKLHAFRDSGML